ncbi:hypothetical protein ACUYGA_16920 [Metapseudomonas otitidis]|uniref:hypothetical protein n=1 Tax=Metapseudomonas otitidis TaxID=319939 RepID=UPI0040557593
MTFQRESRYIVVKLKDLAPGQEADIREHLTELSAQPVDSLVIESDWPEYEPAWEMIQARMEGATPPAAPVQGEVSCGHAACKDLGEPHPFCEFVKQVNSRATLSPAHIEDGEEVEVVGTLIIGEQGWDNAIELNPGPVMALADAHPKSAMPLMTVAQHQRMTAALVARNEWLEQVAIEAAETEKHALQVADAYRNGSAALSAPPAAGVPIGMACKINGYWEAQLFAGHGCIDRQSLYAHPLPPADVPTGLAHRLLKAYDHGDTGAIEAAIEDIRTMLAAAPTPPASEQQRAVVMPELHDLNHHERYRAGWNACVSEFLRLNPHLAKGEGV